MAQRGFAVAAFRDAGVWRVEPLPPAVLEDLGVLLSALRSQPPEGGPFVIACVDEEFFLIARQDGPRISLLLSDLTASVEYPLAAQALARLGEEPPDDDELDEVWPVGDLDLFADLGLTEDEMEQLLDDLDAYPDEMLDSITERIGLGEVYARATELAGPMSAFAAVLARTGDRWRAEEVSLEDCESIADIADVARDVGGQLRIVLIEQDDEYAAIVRLDDRRRRPAGVPVRRPRRRRVPAGGGGGRGARGDRRGRAQRRRGRPAGTRQRAVRRRGDRHRPRHVLRRPAGHVRARGHAADRRAGRRLREGRLRRRPSTPCADEPTTAAVALALAEARTALRLGEVPIGAVVLDPAGQVIATGHNERETGRDPTAHAEVVALRRAGAALGSWYLDGCTLAVTLEPCTMCAGAVVLARIGRLVFGAWDPKAGAVGSLWDVVRDRRLNHRPEVAAGVGEAECGLLLADFFAARR